MAEADAVQPNTPPVAISQAEAAARFKAQRTAQGTNNPLTEAARTLGQRGAEARKERQAAVSRETQEAPVEGAEQQSTDTAELATDADVATDQTHLEPESQEQTAPSELDDKEEYTLAHDGDGKPVVMSRAEIRENILRQADYTRKTQAHAERVKGFEADREQRLRVLDALIGGMRQEIGQPKPMVKLIEELGTEDGIRQFAAQQERFEKLSLAEQVRHNEMAHDIGKRRESTLTALADKHGDKAPQMFDQAIAAAKAATGMDEKTLLQFLVHPAAVEFVADAMEYRAMKAGKPQITKMVAGKPAVIRPGTKTTHQAAAQSGIQRAQATLKTSGKLADGVALLRAQRAGRRV
jgi:hypothetical protein